MTCVVACPGKAASGAGSRPSLSLEGDGTLIFEADVDGIAKKQFALAIAAAMPNLVAIIDREVGP